MKRLIAIISASMGMAAGSASAAPVAYEGVLVPNVAASGNVTGFSWFLDSGTGVDFWRFSGIAGQKVTFEVDRLNANLDPGLSLFSGITTADTSAYSSSSNWGGLTFIGSLDDEHAPFTGGASAPNGDPYGTFTLAATGNYTLSVGGSLSTDGSSYPYRLVMTVSPVPEPATWAMTGLGLGWLGLAVRRRKGRAT